MKKDTINLDKLSSLKNSIIILLLFQSFVGFGQILSTAELKKEALEVINPIYAKIISKDDTTIIFKNELLSKKEILSSLKLISVDTIMIDTTIVYEQTSNYRKFLTLPQYSKYKAKYVRKLNINGEIQEEVVEEERSFVKKYPEILKFEKWELKYQRDTIIVQTKWEVERIVNIPEQYIWSLDTVWLPEEEQFLSLARPAKYEIVEETYGVAPKINRWVRKTPTNHKNDCCYWGIDEECMGFWVLEEIPIKFVKIKKAVVSSNVGCGEAKPIKITYKVVPKKVLLAPASKTIEKFPAAFEQKIERSEPLNTRKYQKETLEIQAIELIYIYER
jgi:hypothetical protein